MTAYTTTATRTRKHLADNGTARCSTEGATLPATDSEARNLKLCFLCSSLPAPTTDQEVFTGSFVIGERIANFLVANVLDPNHQADLIAAINAAPATRYGNGARKTLILTHDQRTDLAHAISSLHDLMRIGVVKTTQTGFRASALPRLVAIINN